MASIQKRGDSWRAIVKSKGVVKTKTFARKSDAMGWAVQTEADLRSGMDGAVPNKTVGDLVTKYVAEVSPLKDGYVWEARRGKSFMLDPLSQVSIRVLNKTHIASWRDRRLLSVAPGTVLREWNFLSAVFTKAIKEWCWLFANPMSGVQRPEEPPARDRLISDDEIERIKVATGYRVDTGLVTKTERVGAAFLFAIETGMRIGEICNLRRGDLFLDSRYVKVTGESQGGRKTRAAKRDVPLSAEALRILKQLPEDDPVFGLSTASADPLFRRAVAAAAVTGVTFHDTRHLAITRLSKKLDVLALARMVGHKDLRQLQVYYNETAAELASRL